MSKRFNKKKSVRFVLVPGTDELGNPTTMFKPVETRTKLSKKEREKVISQISDYQIQIDGKPVDESELPSFVLEQIRGRADLVFNQKNPDLFFNEQDEGDQQIMQKQEEDEFEYEEGQLIPEQQYMQAEDLRLKEQYEKNEKTQLVVEGKKYEITKEQMKVLGEVLPEDYENYKIDGVQFFKYDQDGLRLDQKQKYKKYLSQENQKRAIVDSYIFVPEKPVDIVDDDMDGEVLKGDLKDVDEALNFDGEEGVYEQLEDDFFSKLLDTGKGQQKKNETKNKTSVDAAFRKNKNINNLNEIEKSQKESANISIKLEAKKVVQQKQIKSKLDELEGDEDNYYEDEDEDYEDEDQEYEDLDIQQKGQKITDEMLDKALKEFDQKQVKYQKNVKQIDYKTIPGTAIPVGTRGMDLVKLIQSRQQCVGRDGELDWRTLTKKQKKQYMKNKQIRQIYDEAREREIKDKMVGKVNVKEEDLHLKQYVKHIDYSEDHVMQQALERNQNEVINIQEDQEYETDSDQDDIISYRAKTSIISSNLATVEERGERRKKKSENGVQEISQIKNIEKIKVIMEKRNKKETPQQRKQRKQKLKELKKQKKQQKKQFSEVFFQERKKVMKKQNTAHNPLYKVSYVKIV